MKRAYNLKTIMCRAWDIYRANWTEGGLRPVFGICLAMAWEDIKNSPENVIAQWEEMTDKQKINLLTASVKKAAKNEIAYSTQDKYNQYNEVVLWELFQIDDLINETVLKLIPKLDVGYLKAINQRREQKRLTNISLVALTCIAAKNAIRCMYRNELKHGRASVRTIQDKNGNDYNYIDAMATSPKDNTEKAAFVHIAIENVVNRRDEYDRIIIEGKRDGYTEREIARIIDMSGPAVHKRIKKIRSALAFELV